MKLEFRPAMAVLLVLFVSSACSGQEASDPQPEVVDYAALVESRILPVVRIEGQHR